MDCRHLVAHLRELLRHARSVGKVVHHIGLVLDADAVHRDAREELELAVAGAAADNGRVHIARIQRVVDRLEALRASIPGA